MRGPESRGGGGQREGAVPALGRYGLEGFAFVQAGGEEVAINFLPPRALRAARTAETNLGRRNPASPRARERRVVLGGGGRSRCP